VSCVPYRCLTRRLVLLGALTMMLQPRLASAHAILEMSEPANGAHVPAGPVTLKLRYNSRIDRQRSGLTLTGPNQSKTALRIDADGPPDLLTSTVTLTPGAYVVRWQVLAIDGHITRGDVGFTVTGP
jgi:copper resistance protein C